MDFQRKILVIEDDEQLGATIQHILMVHKFDVCYTNNGASGIQKAFEYNPDLILCDINMDTIDGYQVYKVLEESSILNRIPFIFLTGSSELEDIRYGMSLGADDYLVKPFVNDDLLRSIEKRLEKFRTIKEEARHGFNQLFDISPVGIFLFDENQIFKANKAFINMFKPAREHIIGVETSKIFTPDSFLKVQNRLKGPWSEKGNIFDYNVVLIGEEGNETEMILTISEFEKFSNYRVFMGVANPVNKLTDGLDGKQYAAEIYSLLKRENIKISEALGEKITEIFKQKNLNLKNQNNTFFTKRENEILCLSMEGLPIKLIADRLSISDRTVEKHRTKLMEKSGANNMIEVIVFALKNSLVEI